MPVSGQPPVDVGAILNKIASGPPPVSGGVQRVPIPQITLPAIGQVPVPDMTGLPGGPSAPVVPGQPLPTGSGDGGGQSGVDAQYNVGGTIPGVGNVIGKTNQGTSLIIGGPKGERQIIQNPNYDPKEYYAGGKQFKKLAGITEQQNGDKQQQAPAPHIQHMANATGYTGSFQPGAYESWLSSQPAQTRQAAHTAFGQAATMAPIASNGGTSLGSLLQPRRNA